MTLDHSHELPTYLGLRAHSETPSQRAADIILSKVLVQERQDAYPLGPLLCRGVDHLDEKTHTEINYKYKNK